MSKIKHKFGLGEQDIRDWFFLQPNGLLGQFNEFGGYICNIDLTPSEALCVEDDLFNLEVREHLVNSALNEEPIPEFFAKAGITGSRLEIALKRHELSEGVIEAINMQYSLLKTPHKKSEIENLITAKHEQQVKCVGVYSVWITPNKEIFLSVTKVDAKLIFSWSDEVLSLDGLFE